MGSKKPLRRPGAPFSTSFLRLTLSQYGKAFANLFSLSYDAINGMKKKGLVDHIENFKGKVVVGNDIQDLFNQIYKLSENVDCLLSASEKLNCELLIVRNINQNLQNRTVNLEKQQSKSE